MTDTELPSTGERLDVEIEALDCAPVPILRVRPVGARQDAALLHFHGGGYRKGSPQMFVDSVARIAAACEIRYSRWATGCPVSARSREHGRRGHGVPVGGGNDPRRSPRTVG